MKFIYSSAVLSRFAIFVFLLGSLAACQDKEKKEEPEEDSGVSQTKMEEKESKPQVMNIVTNAMEFKTKDTWDAGWTTVKYRNNSNETHFVLFDKYPEGKTIEDAEKEVGPPFQEGMDLINEGKFDEANEAFGKLPEWFQEVEYTGGVGLVSAKSTAESTIYLEPGTYIIECYVKMANGVFHNTQGMTKQIEVVASENNEAEAPKADYTITVNNENGIVMDDMVYPGEKTFAVNFEGQKVHENYVMQDVHLVWVDRGADMAKLNSWMNWADPKGLQTPSPEGFKFLGGMQELKEGKTGYFTAELKPGNYALISEVPDPQSKGLLKTFSVK